MTDPIIAAVEQLAMARHAENVFHTIFRGNAEEPAAATFHATFIRVEQIEPHPGLLKARVHYQAGDQDPEHLDTDPLSHPWATHVHTKAAGCVEGDRVVIVKRNAPDPSGKTPAGFRRIIWLHNTSQQGF